MGTDNRASIEVELSDEEFLELARIAHTRDITFNQLVGIILQDAMNKIEKDSND